jgi:hypothetical protein
MRGVWLLALLCVGCPKREAAPERAAPSALVSAGPVATAVSELRAAGLHIRSGTLPGAQGTLWGFTDVGLEPARTRLQIVLTEHGAPLAQLLPAGGLAVINGGYFEADFRPSTWLKDGGRELSPKSDPRKGGVLALAPGVTFVGPLSQLSFEPELAIQSFPLILEPDGRSGIHRDDGRRAARTVACLVGEQLHLIVVTAPRGEGPTLFESAGLMKGFGCRVALNLDGGPSTGIWFAPQLAARQRPPLANVGYALAILPR